jgi:hypothetical protein
VRLIRRSHRWTDNVRPNPQSSCNPPRVSPGHRDTYLEQRQTEKLETETRDVERIQITKVYACCVGWPSGGGGGGGHKSAPVRHKHMLYPPACNVSSH